jgi:hypothetical protein
MLSPFQLYPLHGVPSSVRWLATEHNRLQCLLPWHVQWILKKMEGGGRTAFLHSLDKKAEAAER